MTDASIPQPSARDYRQVELDVEADKAAIIDVDEWAFALHNTPEDLERRAFTPEAGRTLGIRHVPTGDLVAVHSSYAFTMAVPGGEVPTAGLTWVGVHPGHRRRGLATAMLHAHLRRTAGRGEPLSALFAAEPEIHGRYGYGQAATQVAADVPRRAALRPVPGTDDLVCTLERLDPTRHRDVVVGVQARSVRPGRVVPSSEALIANQLTDLDDRPKGAEPGRIAVVRDETGDPLAFAVFHRVEKWDDAGPAGTVKVAHAVTLSAAAARVLWATLTDLDLMATVSTPILAPDDPLFTLLVNMRAPRLRLGDNLWVRIVDVPAALAGRRYAAPVDIVLDVTDEVFPANAGRWRLSGGPRGAEVSRTGDPADIALDVRDLGAAYLGGPALGALEAAGLVAETTPGALAVASAAFGWHQAPVCTWIF
ncbi:GNAT family N-acetyltransferase [Propionicicella superfundia]|uniref:GNAT family N-acetyltransferase n=1 Tax=Propionicicella superfundia TaxID=348582 RepID=UPI0004003C62|nr:GNAT family N-acetyltransferase [Propionicicella superfundia]